MEKWTQVELLSEGFWDSFKKAVGTGVGVARGAVAGAAKALDYVAPEITRPLKGAEAAAKDIGGAAKTQFDRYSKGLKQTIADNLDDMGYQLDPNSQIKRNGKNYVVSAFKVRRYDDQGNRELHTAATPFLADKQGNIIRRISH
jgi:hypothetical protein